MSVFKDTRALATAVVGMVDSIMKGEEPEVNDTESYDNGTGVIPTYLCDPVVVTVDNLQRNADRFRILYRRSDSVIIIDHTGGNTTRLC